MQRPLRFFFRIVLVLLCIFGAPSLLAGCASDDTHNGIDDAPALVGSSQEIAAATSAIDALSLEFVDNDDFYVLHNTTTGNWAVYFADEISLPFEINASLDDQYHIAGWASVTGFITYHEDTHTMTFDSPVEYENNFSMLFTLCPLGKEVDDPTCENINISAHRRSLTPFNPPSQELYPQRNVPTQAYGYPSPTDHASIPIADGSVSVIADSNVHCTVQLDGVQEKFTTYFTVDDFSPASGYCEIAYCTKPRGVCQPMAYTYNLPEEERFSAQVVAGEYEHYTVYGDNLEIWADIGTESIQIRLDGDQKVRSTAIQLEDDDAFTVEGTADGDGITIAPKPGSLQTPHVFVFQAIGYTDTDFQGDKSDVVTISVVYNDRLQFDAHPQTVHANDTASIAIDDIVTPSQYGTIDFTSLRLIDENDLPTTENVSTPHGQCQIDDRLLHFVAGTDVGQTDTCTLQLCDERPATSCVNQEFTFLIVGDANAQADSYTVANNNTLHLQLYNDVTFDGLLDNDGDVDATTFQWLIEPVETEEKTLQTLQGGTLALHPDGGWLYTPPSAFEGDDTLLYEICAFGLYDLEDNCTAVTVLITVTAPASGGERLHIQTVLQNNPYDGLFTMIGQAIPNASLTFFANETKIGQSTVGTNGTWTWSNTKPLAVGTHTITVTANSGASDHSTITVQKKPNTSPETPPQDGDLKPTIRGKDKPNSTIEIIIDGHVIDTVDVDDNGDWTWTPTQPMEPGTYTIIVRGSDNQDTSMEIQLRTSSHGGAGDVITILRPQNHARTAQKLPRFMGKAHANTTIRAFVDYLQVDTISSDEDGDWSWIPPNPLRAGTHRASFYAENGHKSVVDIVIENASRYEGDIQILSPDNDAVIEGTHVTVTGKASSNTTVILYLNGSPQETLGVDEAGQWQWTSHELDEGAYDLMVVGDNGSTDERHLTLYQSAKTSGCTVGASSSHPARGGLGFVFWAVCALLLVARITRPQMPRNV